MLPRVEVDQDLLPEETHVRVTAAFNRLLGFSGTVVEKVVFHAAQILVTVRLRSHRLRCPCGQVSPATYDRSQRSWRHLDLGRYKVIVHAQVRRLDCRGCGRVHTEQVPWARPGARHTRDFEDTASWLVRRMSKAAVATLLRTTWNTVDGLVRRLVSTHLESAAASQRLARLARIGVDETPIARVASSGSVALGARKIAACLIGEAVHPSPLLAAAEVGVRRVQVSG